MARALRIEYPGAVYHVTSRGNGGERIFRDDVDRETFLATLAEVVARFGWLCHAYCLMGNHYHVVVETPRANLALGMRRLNSTYAQRFNCRHARRGHLFQGRYRALVVEKERHLLELSRYVVLNPVRAGLVASASVWPWSSYRATAGEAPVPAHLTITWLLGQFGETLSRARQRYAAFVADGGGPNLSLEVTAGLFVGSEEFIARVTRGEDELAEIPRRQLQPLVPPLRELFANHGDEAIAVAAREYGYRLREIADHLGVHYATVSRRLRRLEAQRATS